jgi:ribosome biogenesis GTPase / thiamine phosphate phosphatase
MTAPPPSLATLGWSSRQQVLAETLPAADSLLVGRVIMQHRGRWTVSTPIGIFQTDLPGRFRLGDPLDIPAVGDWVRFASRPIEQTGTIADVVPRTSALVRTSIGGTSLPQVIAANVDIVLVVIPFDVEINVRRIERQLTTVWESGARPVLVGTKSDVALDGAAEAFAEASSGIASFVTSAVTGEGLDHLVELAARGVTLVLLGTSGAGKSTIVNWLIGSEAMATAEVGVSGKGRHTTTHRELLILPTGALMIDTPGMRELGLWVAGGEDGLAATFADIDEVAESCRFSDCRHQGDHGCAIAEALDDETLSFDRVEAWRNLAIEQASIGKRRDERMAAAKLGARQAAKTGIKPAKPQRPPKPSR